MPKSIFISHVHEDITYRNHVARWIDDGHLGHVVATSETTDVRQHGDSAIRAHLQPKMRGAAVVLGLIGQNSRSASASASASLTGSSSPAPAPTPPTRPRPCATSAGTASE
ncbi:MAG: hypothetical protein IPK80_27720 [Nannocystis sp.]|nr:hypothetical protein [Nannocystis sp.]